MCKINMKQEFSRNPITDIFFFKCTRDFINKKSILMYECRLLIPIVLFHVNRYGLIQHIHNIGRTR